jgi:hypothetical protein
MADQDPTTGPGRDARGREGVVREARPEDAAQDLQAAARQEQLKRDSEAIRESARRVESSTPEQVRDRTVHEITRDVEREAGRGGTDGSGARR